MKIENAVDLKTFPEIKVKLKFPFSFPFQFFSVVGEVRKQVALTLKVWKRELHETFVDNDLKNGWLLNFEG